MNDQERAALMAWLDEQINSSQNHLDKAIASRNDRNTALWEGYNQAYELVVYYLEAPVSELEAQPDPPDELTQLRKIVAECCSLTDLMRYGMTIDEGRALLVRCEAGSEDVNHE